jgi:hypothetical protein
MNEYLEELGKVESESVKHGITKHLRQLQNSFEKHFLPNSNDNWLRKPFIGSFRAEGFSVNETEELIDFASD